VLVRFPLKGKRIRGQLRHDRECEIVSVAAGVAGLEVVAVDCDNAAVGQVAKGTADGIS
jgi:hypothetical protein